MNISKLTDNYTKNICLTYDNSTYASNKGKNALVHYIYLKLLESLNNKNVNIYFDSYRRNLNNCKDLYIQTDYNEYFTIKNISYINQNENENNIIFNFGNLYNNNGYLTRFGKLNIVFNKYYSYNKFKIHGYVSEDKKEFITELIGSEYNEFLYTYNSIKQELDKSKRLIIIDKLLDT